MNTLTFEKLIPREVVHNLEAVMKIMPNQVELPVSHHFSLGIYARALYIPRDCTLVGKLHKYPQLNILAQGRLSCLIDNKIELMNAVQIISSPAGTKRVAYAHEDSIWITVHSTEETDVDKIEQHFIAQSEEEYLEFIGKSKEQLLLDLEA